jgi:hypothetical protein
VNPPSEDEPQEPQDAKPPTFWQMLHSVLTAAFGVQGGRNRERDFAHGKPMHFAIIGLAFTLVLTGLLFGVVQLTLYFALG